MPLDWLSPALDPSARKLLEERLGSRKQKLFGHQKHALDELMAGWRAGQRWLLVALPTGAGKTRLGAEVVRLELESGRRVLWLAHRLDLVTQTVSALLDCQEDTIGVIRGDSANPNPYSRLQVATVQALSLREKLPEADLLVIDEAHHYATHEWRAVLQAYPGARRLMLSATPERADGVGLGSIAERIIAPVQPRELVAEDVLVPCAIVGPRRDLEQQLAQDPCEAWLRWAEGRRTIIFCSSIPHARDVAARFTARGISAASVDQDTPAAQRQELYQRLRSGSLRVLTNVYIATEGLDVPEIEVCMIARNVAHRTSWIQMVGRVVRKSPGKRSALVIDLCGLTHRFGPPEQERWFELHHQGAEGGVPLNTDQNLVAAGGVQRRAVNVLGESLQVLHGGHLLGSACSDLASRPPSSDKQAPALPAPPAPPRRFDWEARLRAAVSSQERFGWLVVGALYRGFSPQDALVQGASLFQQRYQRRVEPAWRKFMVESLLGMFTGRAPGQTQGWPESLRVCACYMDVPLRQRFRREDHELQLRALLAR